MKLFIMALEPIETRYTCEWYDFLPKRITEFVKENGINAEVINVSGGSISNTTTPGAFLDFSNTIVWKNRQMNTIAQMFKRGKIHGGDKFLFTDAWNPAIIQLRYMSDLLDIPVEIYSIWHAGSYDPHDFLGRKIRDKQWVTKFEKSLFFASDMNFFATRFHYKLFALSAGDLNISEQNLWPKASIAGLPFEYLNDIFKPIPWSEKENIIVFPHRLSPEKQPKIFKDLEREFTEYKFICPMELGLSKNQYRELLMRSKFMFSANLQETLGITAYECLLSNCVPFLPDRLSYHEIYPSSLLYPEKFTKDYEAFIRNKDEFIQIMREFIDNIEDTKNSHESNPLTNMEYDDRRSIDKFFDSTVMLKSIFKL